MLKGVPSQNSPSSLSSGTKIGEERQATLSGMRGSSTAPSMTSPMPGRTGSLRRTLPCGRGSGTLLRSSPNGYSPSERMTHTARARRYGITARSGYPTLTATYGSPGSTGGRSTSSQRSRPGARRRPGRRAGRVTSPGGQKVKERGGKSRPSRSLKSLPSCVGRSAVFEVADVSERASEMFLRTGAFSQVSCPSFAKILSRYKEDANGNRAKLQRITERLAINGQSESTVTENKTNEDTHEPGAISEAGGDGAEKIKLIRLELYFTYF